MKKPLAALTAAVALVCSGMTFAASTVELAVVGVITPSACTPTLSGNGLVDHGKLSAKDLNLTTATNLPTARLQFNVDCEAQTLFALRTTDNRAGSSTSTFWISLRSPVADNVAAEPIESLDGVSWRPIDDVMWQSQYLAAFGDGSTGQNRKPIPLKNVIVDLLVDTQIAAANSLDLSNEVLIDGSTTIEVKYL